ncbi:hypothetical protein D9611_014001 [Ephemerocybe angulata]|uniref:SWI/SNF and RSC complexes subunit Ssr4 N-terminal domain-containing protein n=1 Tax=Ephemerocybe angulata TaxID=980116 RepID=A0A8H5AQL8_9AGAR|nr:hypothetical protein D9611_014001 [Tulosesus angulatus]
MSFQQATQDGLCLQYPDPLPHSAEVSLETAVTTLMRAIQMSENRPFHYRYIDKPAEGTMAMLFLDPRARFPNDGIRWQEPDTVRLIPAGGGRELEVSESRFGFVPGSQDQNAWRLRRRYRLVKGGHPSLVLVHYTRGPPAPISPGVANLPVRVYPLRTVNEPPTIVIGDKAGQKFYPPGTPGPGMQPPPPPSAVNAPGGPTIPGGPPGMGNMAFNHPGATAAMVNQQNAAMEQLERRREREREKERAAARERAGSTSGRPQHINDDGSDDETDQISTRTLALTRYKRNHEFMNDVFRQAAFGDKNRPPQPSPYSIFNKEDLERKTAQLQADIELLKQKTAERQKGRGLPDVSMEGQALTA